jgi:hypothetical protein
LQIIANVKLLLSYICYEELGLYFVILPVDVMMLMKKEIKLLYKRAISYFDNMEMYQILLKYNNGIHLTVKERQELDYWIYVYDYRSKLYKHLTEVIELQQQIRMVDQRTDLYRFLDKVKECVPAKYIDTSTDTDFFGMRSTVAKGLKSYSTELVLRLIRNHMWGAIIAFIAILVLVIFLIFMIIRFS